MILFAELSKWAVYIYQIPFAIQWFCVFSAILPNYSSCIHYICVIIFILTINIEWLITVCKFYITSKRICKSCSLSLSLSFDIRFGNGGWAGARRGLGCYQDSMFVCVCGVQVLHYKWKNIYFIFHWELLFLFVCYSNIWFCLKPLHSCFHKDF